MIRRADSGDVETIAEFNYKMAYETENPELDKEKVLNGVKSAINDVSKAVYYLYEKGNSILGQLMITK
ncbi:MAG: hypothetical protein ACOCQW_01080 [Halanaerobiaceae bacterium]